MQSASRVSDGRKSRAPRPIEHQMYVRDVVFATGIADGRDHHIVAWGEADLACRITHIPKSVVT